MSRRTTARKKMLESDFVKRLMANLDARGLRPKGMTDEAFLDVIVEVTNENKRELARLALMIVPDMSEKHRRVMEEAAE